MYHMVQRLVVTTRTVATPHEVYAALRDPDTWTAWSGMDSVRLDTPAVGDPNGVGSVRALDRGRVHGHDQIVELIDGQRFSYIHLRGLPVLDYRADVDLEPVDGGTQIAWRVSFRPKYAGTGWVWRRGIEKMLREMTTGLAAYCEAHAKG